MSNEIATSHFQTYARYINPWQDQIDELFLLLEALFHSKLSQEPQQENAIVNIRFRKMFGASWG